MNWSENRLAFFVAVLLVVASALYAVGTAIEHSQRTEHHAERQLASVSANTDETPTEKKGESSSSSESSGETTNETTTAETTTAETATVETTPEATTPTPETTESGNETHSEKIAGIDPESWPLVGVAISISLLVAAGVYWRKGGWLVAAIVLGIVFAAADTRELIHQIQESRTAVATIAGILIALHLLAALGAAAARRMSAVARP